MFASCSAHSTVVPAPDAYQGEWRVDLHPRSSRNGHLVCFDSAHGGQGRQMYLADISSLLVE